MAANPMDLANPMGLRAEMARQGLTFDQLRPYEDPEHGYVDPFQDPETRAAVRTFMARLWGAATRAAAHAALTEANNQTDQGSVPSGYEITTFVSTNDEQAQEALFDLLADVAHTWGERHSVDVTVSGHTAESSRGR